MTVERDDDGGPFGAAYTITVYLDDDGNEVDKDKATRALMASYSAADEWLGESILVKDK